MQKLWILSLWLMKRVLIFALLFALVVVLSGAKDDIYVDTTTGVLYFRTWGIDGFTPLYNADGSLKIWDGYKDVK